jgi:hypothetical protein
MWMGWWGLILRVKGGDGHVGALSYSERMKREKKKQAVIYSVHLLSLLVASFP